MATQYEGTRVRDMHGYFPPGCVCFRYVPDEGVYGYQMGDILDKHGDQADDHDMASEQYMYVSCISAPPGSEVRHAAITVSIEDLFMKPDWGIYRPPTMYFPLLRNSELFTGSFMPSARRMRKGLHTSDLRVRLAIADPEVDIEVPVFDVQTRGLTNNRLAASMAEVISYGHTPMFRNLIDPSEQRKRLADQLKARLKNDSTINVLVPDPRIAFVYSGKDNHWNVLAEGEYAGTVRLSKSRPGRMIVTMHLPDEAKGWSVGRRRLLYAGVRAMFRRLLGAYVLVPNDSTMEKQYEQE